MGPMLHRFLATERAQELRRAADASRRARPVPRPPIPVRAVAFEHAVTIRYAFPDDAGALMRLAALDSAEPPATPVLVAEVDGELRAALSLVDGAVVADPFHPAGAVLDLLRTRGRQLAASRPYTEPPGSLRSRARVSLARMVRRSA